MKTARIEFTIDEAQSTVNLINAAVKAIGLDDGGLSARNGAFLSEKIRAAFPAEETPKEVRDKVVKKGKK